jgi:hypothetical protein
MLPLPLLLLLLLPVRLLLLLHSFILFFPSRPLPLFSLSSVISCSSSRISPWSFITILIFILIE